MTLLYLCVAALCGVYAGHMLWQRGLFGCGLPAWLWLVPAALLLLAPLLRRFEREPDVALVWPASAGFRAPRRGPGVALIVTCALSFVAGALRSAGQPLYPCWTPHDLAWYNQPASRAFDYGAPWVTVAGTVSAYVPQGVDSTRMYVAAESIMLPSGARPVQGKLTLLSKDTRALQYGDPVTVRGVLSLPPEFADFSYRDYLARHGVYSQMAIAQLHPAPGEPGGNPLLRALYHLRSRGETLINGALPEPYAALANGILLGIDANIPDALLADFSETSATHTLVISGSNVALITGVLVALGLRLFGRRGAAVWAVGGVALYAVVVGAEPSVLRAALMGALVVLAVALRRESTALVALGAASLALVLANPHTLWDVGFQLSAMATAGLVLIAPRFARRLRQPIEDRSTAGSSSTSWWRPSALFLVDSLAVTLAATIAVTPLLLLYFHRLSLVGLLTNLLIAPVQPLILFAGMAALVVGLVGLVTLSLPLFWLTWVGLAWTVAIVERTASVPWASAVIAEFGAAAVVCAYAILGLALWQSRRQPIYVKARPQRTPAWQRTLGAPATLAAMAAASAFVWYGVFAQPDGRLHLYVFPSESGASLLIQTPSGRQALIDGGDDGGRLLTQLGGVVPPWDRSLDLVILTRGHARTAGVQVDLARRLRVGHAFASRGALDGNLEWAAALKEAGAEFSVAAAGGWIDLGDGVALWALAPDAGDDEPLVLWLEYGEFVALLPGETPKATTHSRAWAPPRPPDLLFLPDAGAKGEDRSAFAGAIGAEQIVAFGDAVVPGAAGPRAPLSPATSGMLEISSDGVTWKVEE